MLLPTASGIVPHRFRVGHHGIESGVPAATVSGEVEPALLFRGDGLDDALVSVIVDFTDREQERRSIARSKELPKPLSRNVWRYNDIAAVWDQMAMRSWTAPGPDRELYQCGKLDRLLAPRNLLTSLRLSDGLAGTVLLMDPSVADRGICFHGLLCL